MKFCKICHTNPIMADGCEICSSCSYIQASENAISRQHDAKPDRGLKYDDGKLRYSLIPPILLSSVAEVLTFGAAKYAPNSWQTVPNGPERYLDALYRHLEQFRNGEALDPESGLPHLAHVATNVAFLLHFHHKGPTL